MDGTRGAEWASRAIASAAPAWNAVVGTSLTPQQTARLRDAAEREGWHWLEHGAGRCPESARSVVLAATHTARERLAGDVLLMAHRGVRSLLVLGRFPRRVRRDAQAVMVREACGTYGIERHAATALREALALWRRDDVKGARRTLRGVAPDDLLGNGLPAALDVVVLAAVLSRELGALGEAEALAAGASLAAALACDHDADGAGARLALARVFLERGQIVRALGVLHGLAAQGDALAPAARVIGHATRIRLAVASGTPELAGAHVEAIERLAVGDPWAIVHLWDARARVRRAVGDRQGVADACDRGAEVALRQGWTRRVARFREQRAAVAAGREEVDGPKQRRRWIVVDDLVAVLETCQEHADEQTAIARVGALVMTRLGASGVAVIGATDGGGVVLGSVGVLTGMPPWLDDLLATGARRPVEPRRPDWGGAPIRTGGRVIGALLCEWAPGALVPEAECSTLIETAAAALAPVVRSLVVRQAELESGHALLADLVGASPPMQAVRESVLRGAASPFPVLIEGESGTGKELVARAVHRLSPRRARRFVALNCAAMADELVEAELFGHARGAYTSAVSERAGLFEDASDGTLFLDEVAELSPRAQAKLLRVLQEGEVRRVGENRPRRVDVRVVAASNRALAAEVQAGRFRADLLYRLDVIRIGVPPLRARLEDLPLLVGHLWRDVASRAGCRAVLGAAVLDALARYDWPGNVRELQNVLASLAVSAPRRGVVPLAALPPQLTGRAIAAQDPLPLERARREFDARYVAAALVRAGGRQAVAARELGLTRQGLAKLMTRLRLAPVAVSEGAGLR